MTQIQETQLIWLKYRALLGTNISFSQEHFWRWWKPFPVWFYMYSFQWEVKFSHQTSIFPSIPNWSTSPLFFRRKPIYRTTFPPQLLLVEATHSLGSPIVLLLRRRTLGHHLRWRMNPPGNEETSPITLGPGKWEKDMDYFPGKCFEVEKSSLKISVGSILKIADNLQILQMFTFKKPRVFLFAVQQKIHWT